MSNHTTVRLETVIFDHAGEQIIDIRERWVDTIDTALRIQSTMIREAKADNLNWQEFRLKITRGREE